jgi:Fe-Mn family superoxide dismutase
MSNRRSFIKTVAITTAGIGLIKPGEILAFQGQTPPFTLPPLPYSTNALEPFIDKQTMEIHHGKHHKAYVDNLNKGIADFELAKGKSLEQLLASSSLMTSLIRNNAGGHYNHSLFWELLTPPTGQEPKENFRILANSAFGSLDKFKEEFAKAATQRFGSGWAWALVSNGKLVIRSTPNQDNPLMDLAESKGYPILALDVWEHAYYLKYQNLRTDYIKAFWNIINWDTVEKRIGEAKNFKTNY